MSSVLGSKFHFKKRASVTYGRLQFLPTLGFFLGSLEVVSSGVFVAMDKFGSGPQALS